jgi:hypothetical protein
MRRYEERTKTLIGKPIEFIDTYFFPEDGESTEYVTKQIKKEFGEVDRLLVCDSGIIGFKVRTEKVLDFPNAVMVPLKKKNSQCDYFDKYEKRH